MADTPFPVIKAELDGAGVAWRVLGEELGPWKRMVVFADVLAQQLRGEPFKALGPPVDDQDRLSRRQLGSAVLLDRAIRKIVDPAQARGITEKVVLEASVFFLQENVPVLKRQQILRVTPQQQQTLATRIAKKFFNADMDITIEGEKKVYFTVRRCRFPELLEAVGERDMAVLFCKGDAQFFQRHQPQMTMTRPQELSTGGTMCDFQFTWKEEEQG